MNWLIIESSFFGTICKAIHYDRKQVLSLICQPDIWGHKAPQHQHHRKQENKFKIPQCLPSVLVYQWTELFSSEKRHAQRRKPVLLGLGLGVNKEFTSRRNGLCPRVKCLSKLEEVLDRGIFELHETWQCPPSIPQWLALIHKSNPVSRLLGDPESIRVGWF